MDHPHTSSSDTRIDRLKTKSKRHLTTAAAQLPFTDGESPEKRQSWMPPENLTAKSLSYNPQATPTHTAVTDTFESKNDHKTNHPGQHLERSFAERFFAIELRLGRVLMELQFGEKVSVIYNPLEYAVKPHLDYLNKYCQSEKAVLFIGMNPGPYGMAQTGVPFGEVTVVKDWLGVVGEVRTPAVEHPKRPILGWQCLRKEVSGSRFWEVMRELSVTPQRFFRHALVHNVCPLIFMSATGKNLTPPDLPPASRRALQQACDAALQDACRLLGIHTVVGIGLYAARRATDALGTGTTVQTLMHPSPANPAANRGWGTVAKRQLMEMAVTGYLQDVVNP